MLYRAATTKYPCYVPILGDSEGAGRTGLPIKIYYLTIYNLPLFCQKRVQRYKKKLKVKSEK